MNRDAIHAMILGAAAAGATPRDVISLAGALREQVDPMEIAIQIGVLFGKGEIAPVFAVHHKSLLEAPMELT